MTSSKGQAAAQAIDNMTEDELAAWIAAGDYTTVGGISIPEGASRRIADAVADPEVAAFGMDLGFGMPGALATPAATPGGGHVEIAGQTHRKAGKSLGFFKMTLSDILISS